MSQGHFGKVYEACEKGQSSCDYAVKVIDLSGIPNYKMKLADPIEDLAAQVGISPLVFWRYNCGKLFITVMERLRGVTLSTYISRGGWIADREGGGRIAKGIWDTMKQMHDVGILHNDLLPRKVFFSAGGRIQIPRLWRGSIVFCAIDPSRSNARLLFLSFQV